MPKSREECLAALRAAPHVIEPNQKYVVDDFRPGDGRGVAQLYHAVYGEMFPVDYVYDPEELVRMEQDFPERHVYQIVLPLGRTGCTGAVDAARTKGYFLGGLLPLWYDQDGLLLQKVAGKPDYSRIKLHPEGARMLLELIRSDHDRPAKTL